MCNGVLSCYNSISREPVLSIIFMKKSQNILQRRDMQLAQNKKLPALCLPKKPFFQNKPILKPPPLPKLSTVSVDCG